MTLPLRGLTSLRPNAARYELLPRVAEIAKAFGDEPSCCVTSRKKLLAETYTPEQLEIKVKKRRAMPPRR